MSGHRCLARRMLIVLLALGLFHGAAYAGEDPPMDPLLRLLIRKGVITREEALEIQKEYDEEKKGTEETTAVRQEVQVPAEKKVDTRLHFGTVIFASYQDADVWNGVPDETSRESRFSIKRAYLDFKYDVAPFLQARVTPDVRQDQTGDWKARFKYIYGKFHWDRMAFISRPVVEFGLAHMPWLDWEESINGFRMQDPMFLERNHIFNSADLGVLFGGNFGGELPESYRKNVNSHYAGLWGSFQLGIYNGGGYHSVEQTSNKAVEARVSFRPLPERLPGFQVTAFGLKGRGNSTGEPDWDLGSMMLSYEAEFFTLTAQYERGTGNQSGSMLDPAGRTLEHQGYSLFARTSLDGEKSWHLIGRHDHFDPDRESRLDDQEDRWIAGIAWRFSGRNYWLLDWEHLGHSRRDIPDENRLQLTLQIVY